MRPFAFSSRRQGTSIAFPPRPPSFPSFASGHIPPLLLFLAAALFTFCQAFGQAQLSADARFLDGLRQRRLFELAEKHCRDRLADQQLTPEEQADFTIELIRTLSEHAAFARPEEREELWNLARQTAADFLRTSDGNPRLILVRVQGALTPLTQGELARQELEAGGMPPGGSEGAKEAIREAARQLEALRDELTREIPLRRRAAAGDDELSAEELVSLQHHVLHQLARAQRNQALLYPPDSADRSSSLLQAKGTLEDAVTQATADASLAARLRLDLAICHRLLGEFEESRRLLGEIESPSIAAELRLAARGERIRLELAAGRVAEAQRQAAGERLIDGQSSPEFDLATLEMCLAQLAAAAATKDQAGTEKWQNLAAQQARLLSEQHGSYWGRRADQLLVRSLPAGAVGNAELLARTADSLYLKGEFDQAIAAYDQAADKALKSGDDGTALELGFKAALVEEQRRRHRQAAERFCAMAVQLRRQKTAPAAHLRGIWNAAQEVRRDGSFEQGYERLLIEQIDTWPASETAQQARLWHGKLLESRRQWVQAAELYVAVPAESEHFSAAVAAAIAAYRQDLHAQAAANKETKQAAEQAVNYLRGVVLGPENRIPQTWSETQRAAALAAAEFALDYRPAAVNQVQQLLTAALDQAEDAPAEWTSAARAQLILALASQPLERPRAEAMLAEMSQASPTQLLDLLSGLSSIAGRSRQEVRREVARLQLSTVKLLAPRRSDLDAAARLTLDRVEAEALAMSGRREQAVVLYERLAKENPADGDIHEALADLLLQSGDKESLNKALRQWRIVAARSKPRTERWLKAKYSVALAQLKLGDKAGAASLLEFTLRTPPGLDGTAWKARYEALLETCRS